MTGDAFLARYPEFASDSSEPLESILAETAARIDPTVFGDRYDEAHGALCAHELWASAFGVSLRQEGDAPSSSKYLDHYKRIEKAVTVPLSMMVL